MHRVGSCICYFVGKHMRIGPCGAAQVEAGQQLVLGERSQEKTLPALLVVNELAFETQVDAVLWLTQIHQPHRILSVVVGKNAIRGGRSVQLHNIALAALYHVNGMHLDGASGGVAYAYPNVTPGLVVINSKLADEI